MHSLAAQEFKNDLSMIQSKNPIRIEYHRNVNDWLNGHFIQFWINVIQSIELIELN